MRSQSVGRSVLVTGATSGIGKATALRLAWEGARVVAVGRNAARLAALCSELGEAALCLTADLTLNADLVRLADEVASRDVRLSGLVVNAGVSHTPAIGNLRPADYDQLMDVNVKGAVFTFVHMLPLLEDEASVVFTGSVAGRKGQPGDALYAGSKGFIRAFARSLGTAPEIMGRRIRVNVVSPGPVRTPLTAAASSDPAANAFVEALVPMGRWGDADEVAEAIAFLLSPAASFTTGADLTVDGGMAHV